MFDVNFYTVSKNTNSTAQPTGQGTVYSCILKKPSSIIDPVLQLQLSAAAVPSWNYCYISAFSRYYFINNWTALSGGIWEAALAVDVLATYKTTIGDTTFLIERASAASDGYLTDTEYPASHDKDTSILTITQTVSGQGWDSFQMPNSFSSGCFILSLINGTSSGYTYYVLSPSEFRQFKQAMYDTISWYDGGTLADGLKKSISNPFQYVNSCMWFPRAPITLSTATNLYFGFWNSNVSGYIMPDQAYDILTMTIPNTSFSKHPQAAARGAYLNTKPYTKVQVLMNPWGAFELDSSFILKGYGLKIYARVDYVTGNATLKVYSATTNGTEKDLLYTDVAMFGIPIPVTQRSTEIGGILNTAVGLAEGTAGIGLGNAAATMGGMARAVSGMMSAATELASPSIRSKGSQGSLASLTDPYQFIITHYPVTAEDNARIGRPLMQNYKPSALNGYMRVVDPDMIGDLGTLGERQQVLSYLSGGFYYE